MPLFQVNWTSRSVVRSLLIAERAAQRRQNKTLFKETKRKTQVDATTFFLLSYHGSKFRKIWLQVSKKLGAVIRKKVLNVNCAERLE